MNEAPVRAAELFGVWRLVSLDAIRPNGEVATGWLGAEPAGLLAYDGSGSMSVQIMSGPRERAGAGRETPVASAGYYAYFGAFEIDAAARTIVHHVQGSLWADEVGVSYTQDFAVSGDRLLLLTAAHRVDGEERRNRIVWQRAATGAGR